MIRYLSTHSVCRSLIEFKPLRSPEIMELINDFCDDIGLPHLDSGECDEVFGILDENQKLLDERLIVTL